MRTGTHSNKRNNSNPFVPTVQTQLQSRPWAEPTEAIADQIEAPELQKEPEERERFGHDLANIPIFAPAAPPESGDLPPIQAKFNDFITDSQPGAIADQIEAPELQKEPEERERFGHDLANIPIFAPATPPEEADLPPIQTKGMTIGAPGDKYEQEADRVARKVVSQINRLVAQRVSEETELSSPGVISQDYSFLGRRKQSDGMLTTFGAEVQRKEAIASGEASLNLESAINTARSGGQPLDAGLQQSMGQAMNADFSRVRVHTDAQSDQLNQSLQAKAFTTGQDVFFRQGAYQPENRAGQELIAHELTHVVQQNGGAVMRSLQRESVQAISIEYSGHEPVVRRQPYYRGGNDLNPKPHEVKIDKKTGKLKNTHGVSLFDLKQGLGKFGGTYEVKSIPETLKIIQRGKNKNHFEIVPAESGKLDFQEFALELKKIVLEKVEDED